MRKPHPLVRDGVFFVLHFSNPQLTVELILIMPKY
jgi:hypothetical protein